MLAAERTPHPGRQPPIVVRVMLVSGPAPGCVGEFLRLASPLASFTARAREVVVQARQEAFELQHLNVEAEHILLALLRRDVDVVAQALSSLQVAAARARGQVVRSLGPPQELAHRQSALAPPFTPRAMNVLKQARTEASGRGHESVEPGHILLGLVYEPDSPVGRVLREAGADPDQIRAALIPLLNPAEPNGDTPNG